MSVGPPSSPTHFSAHSFLSSPPASSSLIRPRSPTPSSPSSRDSPTPQRHRSSNTYLEYYDEEEDEEEIEPQEKMEATKEAPPDQSLAPLVHSPGPGSPWHLPDSLEPEFLPALTHRQRLLLSSTSMERWAGLGSRSPP